MEKGKFIDKTGKKFGRLTVIKRVANNKWGETRWLCKCECGKEKVTVGYSLQGGFTKSCGCLRREVTRNRRRLSSGLSNMRAMIGSYKASAKERKLEYNLTEEQFAELTQQDCYYCGAKPNNIANDEGNYGSYTYSGLDRIDNNKGYVIDNVVPCCKRCNYAKSSLTLQEYKDWIKRSYDRMFR